MVWAKNGQSLIFFFFWHYRRGNVFYDILERKKAFLPYKNRKFKSQKIDIFPKGLTHGFSPKMANFPIFFFRQYRPRKCLLRYSRKKKAFLGYKNKKFKKSRNSHFFQGVNPWFWSKSGHFRNFFFRQYRPGKCLLRNSRTKKMPF